ncbi:lactonase family protein [Paenibacillus protaetiae]|uniref:Lactonase family protein n=1 Tax=Paenibacillus protaetiae TaxID=2509456 RepID=A0A4V0YFC2_9BACL|nr:lactonase family protein [Paenibacillus protaetiae]QAY67201.1 lactonase family protein [Paenibacillus protaetiae]
MTEQQRMLIFAGSYAEPSASGVYTYEWNEAAGTLTKLSEVGGLKNPTFLNLDAAANKLYALAEIAGADGSKQSEAIGYRIDPKAGTLTEFTRGLASNGPTCHIQKSPDSRYLTLTSYHKGTVSLVELTESGEIGRLLDEQQHIGKETDPSRRDIPHPHSSFYSPDGRYLHVPDLGIDRIMTYVLNREAGKLELHGETLLHAGAGPRHLVFHPNGQFVYVINELDSSVTAFAYEAVSGKLTEVQNLSTLPEGYSGDNGCAEIAISADGRYLYGSNRGHDSIVVYAVDAASGKLAVVEHVSTEGGHPRHFSILPGGEFLLVANRDSDNNLVMFRVDQASGKLQAVCKEQLSKPVCVWASRF